MEWTGAGAFVAGNLYGAEADEIRVRYQENPAGYLRYHLNAMGNVQFLLSDQPNPGLCSGWAWLMVSPRPESSEFSRVGWASRPPVLASCQNNLLISLMERRF